jgi:hypothetical protein
MMMDEKVKIVRTFSDAERVWNEHFGEKDAPKAKWGLHVGQHVLITGTGVGCAVFKDHCPRINTTGKITGFPGAGTVRIEFDLETVKDRGREGFVFFNTCREIEDGEKGSRACSFFPHNFIPLGEPGHRPAVVTMVIRVKHAGNSEHEKCNKCCAGVTGEVTHVYQKNGVSYRSVRFDEPHGCAYMLDKHSGCGDAATVWQEIVEGVEFRPAVLFPEDCMGV